MTNQNAFDLIADPVLREEVLKWRSTLDDYLEDEGRNNKHSAEQIRPYLAAKGIDSNMNDIDNFDNLLLHDLFCVVIVSFI